jgi:hypothetical protein
MMMMMMMMMVMMMTAADQSKARSGYITCIISDSFLVWSQALAQKHGIPRVAFWPNSIATLTCTISHRRIAEDMAPLDPFSEQGTRNMICTFMLHTGLVYLSTPRIIAHHRRSRSRLPRLILPLVSALVPDRGFSMSLIRSERSAPLLCSIDRRLLVVFWNLIG